MVQTQCVFSVAKKIGIATTNVWLGRRFAPSAEYLFAQSVIAEGKMNTASGRCHRQFLQMI
jgi:hypothetical protein